MFLQFWRGSGKRLYQIFPSFNDNIESINGGTGTLIFMGAPIQEILDGDGYRIKYTTNNMSDSDGGIEIAGASRRDLNFDITFKFRLDETTVRRAWYGFFNGNPMAIDQPTFEHFGVRASSSAGNVNFVISHADGVTQAETQILVVDTAIHEIRIIAENGVPRFRVSIDGGAFVDITTNIPTATQNLDVFHQVRTLENVAKSNNFWWVQGVTDE